MTKPKVFIIPGNGGSRIETDNWYAWVRNELVRRGYPVFAEDMPDSLMARAIVWLPYLAEVIGEDENIILIGHSSGSVAIMRYLETHRALGAILTGACYTDLGLVEEKLAGYYNTPWQWDKIKSNVGWVAQFASTDDPFIPVSEARFIHNQLNSEYFEFTDRGHFMTDDQHDASTFPELIEQLEKSLS